DELAAAMGRFKVKAGSSAAKAAHATEPAPAPAHRPAAARPVPQLRATGAGGAARKPAAAASEESWEEF
ncbi:methyl-accepting chemotaxis protein, partial [Jiella sp. M17.18]